jgi:hypothetical protein
MSTNDISDEQRSKLDILSALHGYTLWAEFEPEVGMWGVFCRDPDSGDDHADIIGAADDADEAIAEAEEYLS